MSNTLSPELKAQIENEAVAITAKFKDNNDYRAGYRQGFEDGYESGGVRYAFEWQQAEERIKQLEQWKKEAKMLLDPLLNWGHAQKDIPLGMSVTNEILRRAKLYTGAEEMTEKMAAFIEEMVNFPPPQDKKETQKRIDKYRDEAGELTTEYNNYKKGKDDTVNG